MIPFYIFYSMFGFQRTGDQIWAFGDARGRGFLLGGDRRPDDADRRGPPARRRPQPPPRLDRPEHPRLRPGVRLRARGDRPRRHRADVRPEPEDVFYYVTLYNENYAQPPRPDGVRRGDPARASTGFADAPDLGRGGRTRLASSGSGSILQQVLAARELLAEKFGVAAEVYSAPSFQQLRRDALDAERWNRLHPDAATASGAVRRAGPAARRRADRRRHGLDEGAPRHGRALAAGALPRRSAPTGSDAATRARPPLALRDRPAAHRGRDPGRRSSAAVRSRPRKAAKAIKELGIDPEKVSPLAL